ncbi:MAG: L,D-transpeptidase family protein [Anaerolineae bacterium]
MKKIRWFLIVMFALLLAMPGIAQEGNGTHVVQRGENLFRIALRYGVDMDDLAQANNINNVTRIYAGQTLVIPGLDSADTGDEITNPLVATAPITHVVQRGEYLSQIARSYNVSVEQILAANNIATPNTIYAGQELNIWSDDLSVELPQEPEIAPEPPPAEPEPTAVPAEQVVHTVAPGEYLSLVARRYGVPWTSIAEANNIIDTNNVIAGTTLVIPGGDPSASVRNSTANTGAVAQNGTDPGPHWGYGREIVVDLSSQMTYAYEDGQLVFSSLVSTGLPATPTVQGEYAIWHKTPAQTMSGPGYSLPNVQWVMYFYQGYGFHGTYWHNNFGTPMSHGCVNMTNADAEWLYNFGSIGTNVWVQY